MRALVRAPDADRSDCHLLDSYLLQQLQTTSYDLLANLAQLKLYQFNPELSSTSSTLEILFKALVHEPFGPDFALGWSLVGDSFVVGAALPPKELGSDDDEETDEPRAPAAPDGEREIAARLQHLSALLHGRKFRLFWSALREGVATEDPTVEKKVREGISALEVSAVGFEKVLRENIALEIEASFKGLQLSTLETFLGLARSLLAVDESRLTSSQPTRRSWHRSWLHMDGRSRAPS